MLRQGNVLRGGIRQCYNDGWILNDIQYERRKSDKDSEIPWLVDSVSSDGLQVKVTLFTMEKSHSLPKGVREWLEKGFTGISSLEFNESCHDKGVFLKAGKLNKARVGNLPLKEIEIIAVDPGQVCVASSDRCTLENRDFGSSDFKESGTSSFTSKDYRRESLANPTAKPEVRRRNKNEAYDEAIASFGNVSAKAPGTSGEHSSLYSTLTVRIGELRSADRRSERFARLRCKATDGQSYRTDDSTLQGRRD